MKYYLGRRKKSVLGDYYEIGINKKGWNQNLGFCGGTTIKSFCPELFEKLTNVRLKPGEVREIVFIKFELKEEGE